MPDISFMPYRLRRQRHNIIFTQTKESFQRDRLYTAYKFQAQKFRTVAIARTYIIIIILDQQSDYFLAISSVVMVAKKR